MSEKMQGDSARAAALDRIDRAERSVKLWLGAVAVIEAALLLSYIALANFGNRMHLLLFVATLLVYLTLGLGLVALGAYVRQTNLRTLAAIETLAESNRR